MLNMAKIWILQRIGVDTDKPPIALKEGLNKLGRSIENKTTILISSKWVSRSHCDITVREGFVFIKDLGGMNGTYVNNIRLDKERLTELKCGDIISLGKEYIEPVESDHFVYQILATDLNGFFVKETFQGPKRRSSSSPERESGSPVIKRIRETSPKRIRETSPSTLPHQVTSSVRSPTAFVDLTDDDSPSLPVNIESSDTYVQRTEVMIDLTKSDESSKSSSNTDISSCTLNNSSINNNNNSAKGEVLEFINSMREDQITCIKSFIYEKFSGYVNGMSVNTSEDVSFKKPSIPKKSPLQTRVGEILNPIVSSTMEDKTKSINLGMNNEISSSNNEVGCNQVNEIDSHSTERNLRISSVVSLNKKSSLLMNCLELTKENKPAKNMQNIQLSHDGLDDVDWLSVKFKNNSNESADICQFKIEKNPNNIDINSKPSLETENIVANDGNKQRQSSLDFNQESSFAETGSVMSSLDQATEYRFSNISNDSNDSLENMQEIQMLRRKRFGGNEIDLNLKRVEESPKQKTNLNISSGSAFHLESDSSIKEQSQPKKIVSPTLDHISRRKSIDQVISKRKPTEACLNDKRRESLKSPDNAFTSQSSLSTENVHTEILDDSSKVQNMEARHPQITCTKLGKNTLCLEMNSDLGPEGFEQKRPESHEPLKKTKLRRVSNNDPDVERIFNDLVSEGSPITNGASENTGKSTYKIPNENKIVQEATANEYSYNINDIEEHIRRTSVEDSVDETIQNSMEKGDPESVLVNVPFKCEDMVFNEDAINNSFSQDGAIEVDEGDKTFSSLFLDNFEEVIDLDDEPSNPDDNELLVSMIKEEVDEMHEEADIDLFEAHFSQCSQDLENIDKEPDVIPNLDIVEEPLELKPTLSISTKPESQITYKPSDSVTIPMATKTENTSSSKENLSLSSASSEKMPSLPKGLTGAKLVKSTLLSQPPLPPVTPAKRGRKPKTKVESSTTKDAIAKRTKEKINEERKEKLRNLALQKKIDSDQKIKTPSLKNNKDAVKDNAVCSKNIAKITERNRGSILLEGLLENPEPRRSARKSKEKIKVQVEISKEPQTGESKKSMAKLKTSLKSNLSHTSSGNTKKVRFSDDNQVVYFECEGNLNKLNASSSKDKNPLLPQHFQVRRNIDMQINEFIFNVVHWNTSWIRESKSVKGDPPICKEVFRAKDSYVSFNDFNRWLGPMILYELWGNVTKSLDEKTAHKSMPRFDGVVLHKAIRNTDKRLLTLKCCIPLMAKDISSLVDPMDNLVVSASAPTEWSKKLVMFGIVDSQVRVTNIRSANDPFAINYLKSLKTKFDVCAYFDVVVHNTLKSIEPGYILIIRPTYNMMNEMRQHECLNRLQTSPLVGLITDPVNNFSFPLPPNLSETKLISKFPLNEDQTRAVLGATHLALTSKASISLIHGPPGTGKTRVITAIVEQIVHHYRTRSRSNVILVCTQSNSAVDAICLRLLDVRKQLPREKRFRLTRFGRKERVHPKVVDILTTTLARNEIEKMDLAEHYRLEMEILKASETMLALGLDASSSEITDIERQKNRRRYEIIQGSISMLEPLVNKTASEEAKKKYVDHLVAEEELKIINRTDIIATTLGSCTSRRILKALNEPSIQKDNERRTIGVCIVDEASQANEADILLPLIHGVKNFILVGDQQQLPPFVASETGKNYGFGQSLFTRLHKVWSNIKGAEDKIPIFPLRVQHRMHPEIAVFPSANFYEGQLQSPEFLDINRGFKPYAVFTHRHAQDSARADPLEFPDSFMDGHDFCLVGGNCDESLLLILSAYLYCVSVIGLGVAGLTSTGLCAAVHCQLALREDESIPTISFSETNQNEAELLMTILDEIIENHLFKSLSIGIIVPYQKQKSIVLEMVRNRKYHRLVDVNTIDSYQGQERDVVLFSTVRTSGVGFLSDYQRTNVAITRAKRALYILGNFSSLQAETTWKNLLADAQKRGVHKELLPNYKKSDIIGFLTQPTKRKRSTK